MILIIITIIIKIIILSITTLTKNIYNFVDVFLKRFIRLSLRMSQVSSPSHYIFNMGAKGRCQLNFITGVKRRSIMHIVFASSSPLTFVPSPLILPLFPFASFPLPPPPPFASFYFSSEHHLISLNFLSPPPFPLPLSLLPSSFPSFSPSFFLLFLPFT